MIPMIELEFNLIFALVAFVVTSGFRCEGSCAVTRFYGASKVRFMLLHVVLLRRLA